MPDLDAVMIEELVSQQAAFKDVKAKIAKRLEAVADANHYTAKVDKLKQQELANPEKAVDEEKMARNEDKAREAVRKLEEDTAALMDSFSFYNDQRTALMRERCAWLRTLMQVRPEGK